jgi:quinol monooxygenase YgiN
MKQYELKGQTVSISYSKDQKWYYLDHQNTNEATFIKIWDSKEDVEAKSESTHLRPADSELKHLARWTSQST